MKLTIEQVEATLAAVWGKQVFIVPYRLAGNRYSYAVTDHGKGWLPLLTSWVDGHQVFEPADGTWPELKRDPWLDAIFEAYQIANAYFVNRGNRVAVQRLPRALAIAEARQWTYQEDEQDTWLMPSQSGGDIVYQVNGHCTCPDYLRGTVPGGWCKHRLARALAKRAVEILEEAKTAEDASRFLASAPEEPISTPKPDADAEPFNGQAQRIDLVVAYAANEVHNLAHINANGRLIAFFADGQKVTPPTRLISDLYRWLQAQRYVPDEFRWLDWERGLRHRRQTYVREVA